MDTSKTPNRREFLARTGLAALALDAALWGARGAARAGETPPETTPYKHLREAIARANGIGIGGASVDGPNPVAVDAYGTWTYTYTAGKAGMRPGGGIRVGLRHMNHCWSTVQDKDPNADGCLTVSSPENVPLTVLVECDNWSEKFFDLYHPVQNIVEVLVGEPGLKPGETLRIIFGDRGQGSKGMRAQPFDESHYRFQTFVDALGNDDFLPMADSPTIAIVAGEAMRLSVVTPSNAVAGAPAWCVIRAEDAHGNPAPTYRGTVNLESSDPSAKLPGAATFSAADGGVKRIEGIAFGTMGFQTLRITDGHFTARSNPVRVSETAPARRHLWGDLHGHTIHSDGRGSIEEYYDFAENVSALDFCAASDHAFEVTDAMWAVSKRVTNARNRDGRFVTFNAYEWSGKSDVGGDHNVYWLDDDPPIFRSMSYYNPRNLQMAHDTTSKAPHIEDLYAKLRAHRHGKNVFCIPHRGGRAANPEWHDPELQRLIEVFCEHFRSMDWGGQFLDKGYRLGVIGSTDDHYGNPGYGFLKPQRMELIGEGLLAVFAQDHTREGIFTALYDRHCYATTGDRILLDFTVNGHLMGSECSSDGPPRLEVTAAGTAPIVATSLRKNGKVLHSVEGSEDVIAVSWQDPSFQAGTPCFYDVHVVQENGEEALSSAVWVG